MTTRIFITGGASGLGRELALRWARTGARVCIGDLNAARGRAVVDEINDAGGVGMFCACDVTRSQDLQDAADRVLEAWQGVDIVVNNAGVATAGLLNKEPIEQWQWILNINLLGVVRGCQVFAPIFRAQRSGYFVNIASMAGIVHPPAMGSYNAAKAAVVAFSETLRLELGDEIGVSVVCPGFFQTNLTESLRCADDSGAKAMNKLFSKARITAAQIADVVYQAVQERRYLVLPHADDRKAYWLKCFAPVGMYLKAMRKRTGRMVPR